jgi:hypothetical protein
MATDAQSMLMILAQAGAEIEPVLSALRCRLDDERLMLLQQEEGESLTALKRRLQTGLAMLESAGRAIERGAFVARSGFGLPDVLATVALLSSLVAAMVSMGSGQLYLCANEGDPQATTALEALADAMRDQVRGTGVDVITDESPSLVTAAGSGARLTRAALG